jgi:hypothetical protein
MSDTWRETSSFKLHYFARSSFIIRARVNLRLGLMHAATHRHLTAGRRDLLSTTHATVAPNIITLPLPHHQPTIVSLSPYFRISQ